jgi:hypothetical protein
MFEEVLNAVSLGMIFSEYDNATSLLMDFLLKYVMMHVHIDTMTSGDALCRRLKKMSTCQSTFVPLEIRYSPSISKQSTVEL